MPHIIFGNHQEVVSNHQKYIGVVEQVQCLCRYLSHITRTHIKGAVHKFSQYSSIPPPTELPSGPPQNHLILKPSSKAMTHLLTGLGLHEKNPGANNYLVNRGMMGWMYSDI